MTTECSQEPFPFHPLNEREVRGQFDGGAITSDAGGLLVREVEKRLNKNLTGSALMQAVNGQTWDPSVKALTQFPSVLDKMAQSLVWTSQLGEAYHNQQADVMTAVQTFARKRRRRAILSLVPRSRSCSKHRRRS